MKLGAQLLAMLEKTYAPYALVETSYQRYDLAIQTDENGKPVLIFLGKKQENGRIKGERFTRQPKGHWDNKGKIK